VSAPNAHDYDTTLPNPDLSSDALVDVALVPSGQRFRRWGVALDVGAPDGATVALVARPLRSLELSAGLSYNGISNGGRAEATWAPLDRVITPTVSLAVGHFVDGNANPLARMVTGNPMFESPLLDSVGYDYQSAQLGFEVGRRAVAFYVRAGVSRVTGTVHGVGELGNQMAPLTGADPTVTIVSASARLGLVVRFSR
jgi:hypothetical protein